MEWLFLLIAYLPVISAVLGLALLIAGFVLRKTKKKASKGLFLAGALCVGACLVVYLALFFVGSLGIGPVPN